MNERINHIYREWLSTMVRVGQHDYTHLFTIMFEKEFIWLIPNDDNRISDAMDIRMEFLDEHPQENIIDLIEHVSALEVVVALSRRLEFESDIPAIQWAMDLMRNLGLHKYSGRLSDVRVRHVNDILDALIWRQYEPNGHGGFFPLTHPEEDQTQVEIWYQAAAYLNEHNIP